jgi:hypothetical protein
MHPDVGKIFAFLLHVHDALQTKPVVKVWMSLQE